MWRSYYSHLSIGRRLKGLSNCLNKMHKFIFLRWTYLDRHPKQTWAEFWDRFVFKISGPVYLFMPCYGNAKFLMKGSRILRSICWAITYVVRLNSKCRGAIWSISIYLFYSNLNFQTEWSANNASNFPLNVTRFNLWRDKRRRTLRHIIKHLGTFWFRGAFSKNFGGPKRENVIVLRFEFSSRCRDECWAWMPKLSRHMKLCRRIFYIIGDVSLSFWNSRVLSAGKFVKKNNIEEKFTSNQRSIQNNSRVDLWNDGSQITVDVASNQFDDWVQRPEPSSAALMVPNRSFILQYDHPKTI